MFSTDNTNTKKLLRPWPRTDNAIVNNWYGHFRTGRAPVPPSLNMFAATRRSALMKAYLWSTNNGNASWTVNGASRTPARYEIGEWQNREFVLLLLILVKEVIS